MLIDKLNQASKAKDPYQKEIDSAWAELLLRNAGYLTNTSDEEESIEHGYKINPTVYAIVSMIAKKAGSVPWRIMTKGKDGVAVPTENKELQDLMDQPNFADSWSQLMQNAAGFKFLTGNTYFWGVPHKYNKKLFKGPNSLYVLPSQYVNISSPNGRRIDGYVLNFNDVNGVPIDPKEILHQKDFNPDFSEGSNHLYGQSPWQALTRTLRINNKAITTSESYLDNQGPKGLLTKKYQPGSRFTKPQAEELKASFRRENQGASKAGNVLITPEEFNYVNVGQSATDIELLEQYKVSKLDICSAVGFPGTLIGINNETYRNYSEAKKALWTDTIVPFLAETKEGLNRWLAPRYGDIYLDFDLAAVPELYADMDMQASAAGKLRGIATLNEARRMVGLDPLPGEEGNQLMQLVQEITVNGKKDD